MAIEGGVFTNLNERNGYSFPPFIRNSQITNPHNDEP